ncbi:hypothetical protein [Campylobacter concisus]|uniref:hypothetical protein n=1 Tax=Campylobacter concisus TaxID=199 RepID=UPI000CD95ECE|nr:hypothetical protein [Campylobacter concisus]
MQLYNIKEKYISDVPYIITDKATLYTKFLNKEELKELGYLMVVEEPYPTFDSDFKKAIPNDHIKDDTYISSYKVVDKTLDELTLLFKEKTQELLDAKAREKGYDDILSACSYAGYENDFKAEGEAFGVWRAKVWKYGYALLEAISKGKKELPKSFKELIKDMPKLEEINNG